MNTKKRRLPSKHKRKPVPRKGYKRVARSAKTGLFVPLWYAKRFPKTTVVETVKVSNGVIKAKSKT